MDGGDLQRLGAYVRRGDAAAFRCLVDRHFAWVRAAAGRRLHDAHLAEDAAQAVFMMLAAKAAELAEADRASVAGWLFHAMHLTCTRLRRSRRRRMGREAGAGARRREAGGKRCDDNLRVVLEDAIAGLSPVDREAVIGRFYRGQDFAAIGRQLGCSGEAARKRVGRALVHVRDAMLRDGLDAVPTELLGGVKALRGSGDGPGASARRNNRIPAMAKGAMTMMQQMDAIDFTVWSAELFVKDVESNLDFFEKLGFQRHFLDAPDAMGRLPRASLRGGKTARIWLRRASEAEGTRPTPGMTLYFWIEGGADALAAHRKSIVAQGVKASAFTDDLTLRNFTVASPDGYTIGFFTAYR